MFINNIEIKIDSQVRTPMGCVIRPPAYDIFIFSKIYSFIIVQPNVQDLSQRNSVLRSFHSCNEYVIHNIICAALGSDNVRPFLIYF